MSEIEKQDPESINVQTSEEGLEPDAVVVPPRTRSHHYNQVRELCRRAGQPHPERPTELSAFERLSRARLILEEVIETIHEGLGVDISVKLTGGAIAIKPGAVKRNTLVLEINQGRNMNMVELVDGCCDIKVVTTGTLVAVGVADEQPQREVDANNLKKFGPGGYRDDKGKWQKPPGHQPPKIERCLKLQCLPT